MSFVQTISFTTVRMDEMLALMQEWDEENREQDGSAYGFERSQVVKDRDHDGAFMVIVQFASYEQAMENSARPETDMFAKRMAELCDGPPSFGNFDVLDERTA